MKLESKNFNQEDYRSSQENLQSLQTFKGLGGLVQKGWVKYQVKLPTNPLLIVFKFLLSQAKHFLLKNNIYVVKYTTY